MRKTEPLIINLEDINHRLAELKEYLDKLNIVLGSQSTKKCTKHCIEIINVVGELDGILNK